VNVFQELRNKSNLTQEQVASSLGIERSTVAKWETGKAMPTADKLPVLAKLFDCTIDDLFDAGDAAKTG
jgi:transcriptional regulator with XRE-family HTH domain